MKIELIYDPDCPNVASARKVLYKAFTECGISPEWIEHNRSNSDIAEDYLQYGSPTILINGQDVSETTDKSNADCCRLYATASGSFQGVPPFEDIVAALEKIQTHKKDSSGAGSVLSIFSMIGTLFIPGVSCPACWPAYAAILSSLGIGFIDYTPYVLSITLFLLSLSLFLMYRTSRVQKYYLPTALAAGGSLLVLIERFFTVYEPILWFGVFIMLAAAFMQILFKRNRKTLCGCDKKTLMCSN